MKIFRRISLSLLFLVMAGIIMEQSVTIDILRQKNSELTTRISDQVELIDLQAEVAVAAEELFLIVKEQKLEIALYKENVEELTALGPLKDALPWEELIQLLGELPRVNLFDTNWDVTANFGESVGYHGRLRSIHEGLDMMMYGGDGLARAYASGRVIDIGWDDKYGKYLTIQHSDNVRTFYAHAETIFYAADLGQEVIAGQPILRVGHTGQVYSSVGNDGTHLHFELQIKVGETWVPINPRPWLTKEIKDEETI